MDEAKGDVAGGDVTGLGIDPAFAFGRERRRHARAYARWRALAGERPMPSFDDVMAEGFGDLAANSVVIAFGPGGRAPSIAFLGKTLRDQAEAAALGMACAEVPPQSLLGRLLARLPVIVAGRAAIGFEAEGVSAQGAELLHRGILLPLAAADGSLCAVHGVMSWKEAAATVPIDAVMAAESVQAPRAPLPSPWRTGAVPNEPVPATDPLDRRLAVAQTWAALAASHEHRRSHLHAAIGAAHDYAMAAGIEPGEATARVFGGALPRAERARVVGALRHARRLGIGRGRLAPLLDDQSAGHVAFADAERRIRRAMRVADTRPDATLAVTNSLTLVPLEAEILAQAVPRRSETYRAGNPAAMRAA